MPISADNFGFLIAYLLPGFVCLWAVAPYFSFVGRWLEGPAATAPTVGGFLFATLASAAAGLFVSTVRWAVIDPLHHWTGVREPVLDFSRLNDRLQAFHTLVEFHYRYYQFHANLFVAVAFLFALRFPFVPDADHERGWIVAAFLFVEALLFLGSRDTLAKYYQRAEDVLSGTGPDRKPRASHSRSMRP